MEKEIKKIPFGAKDSELYKFEYSIPEGYEARIEDGKVIMTKKEESKDERIRREIIEFLELPHPQFVGKRDHEEWIAWLEKQKEQKPAEWSDKDERMLRTVIDDLKRHDRDAYAAEIKWLKCLDEKFNLQPKQEWSKKDNDMLKSIIATCQLAAQVRDSGPAWKLCEMQEKFLKSLRPQPHWKPSEEQMKVLYSLAFDGGITYFSQLSYLKSLYEDLKSL